MIDLESKSYHAAIYARRKFKDIVQPDEEDLTTAEQIRQIRELMEEYPNVSIDGIYMDRKRMNQDDQRPEFFRMIQDVHAGKYNCIIFYSIETFGKDISENQYYLTQQFPMLNLRIISIKDNYDSNLSEPIKGEYHEIGNLIDKFRKNQRSRTHIAWHQKNQNILYRSKCYIPYGYLYNPAIPSFMEPDLECAPAVRMIFEEYIVGTPTSVICKTLNDKKYPSPSQRKIQLGYWPETHVCNDYWTDGSIRTILKNRSYTGDLPTRVSTKKYYLEQEKAVQKRNPSETLIPEHHEAIISKEQYEKAQIMMKASSTLHSENFPEKASTASVPHLFQNIAYCGLCGRRLRYARFNTKGRYAYGVYRCPSVVKKLPQMCKVPNFRLDEIAPLVKKKLDQERELAIRLQSELNESTTDIGRRPAAIVTAGLDELEKQITDTMSLITNDSQDKLQEHKDRLVSLIAQKREYISTMSANNDWIVFYSSLADDYELSREVVRTYVKRVDVFPNDKVEVTFVKQDMKETLLSCYKFAKGCFAEE